MTREEMLRMMRLLSGLEALGIMHQPHMPDYLLEELLDMVAVLEREIVR